MITYISSKSGQGKTQLAFRMALEGSTIYNNVLIVSYEMDSKNILERISSILENDIHQPKEITIIQCDASDDKQFNYGVFSNQLEQWLNRYGSVVLDGFFTNLGNDLDNMKNVFEKKMKILEDVSKWYSSSRLFVTIQNNYENFWDIELTKTLFFGNKLTKEQKKYMNRVHIVKDERIFHILNLNEETHKTESAEEILFKN